MTKVFRPLFVNLNFPSKEKPGSVCELSYVLEPQVGWRKQWCVLVPDELRQAFKRGDVRAFQMESLAANVAARDALGRAVLHVVTGVQLLDGKVLNGVPKAWRRAWTARIAAAGASGAIATWFLWGGQPIAGAFALVASGLLLRAARAYPVQLRLA